ncbi:hypothetical protein GHT09_002884 [Marmota monax]|uniref:Uncharacterized protein n=1 Tax=Marmota monax TaxID=9995 RepID=A0A834UNU4_MARMO|nr:hypothetical protein GHT09_002884 [Marmota monax]
MKVEFLQRQFWAATEQVGDRSWPGQASTSGPSSPQCSLPVQTMAPLLPQSLTALPTLRCPPPFQGPEPLLSRPLRSQMPAGLALHLPSPLPHRAPGLSLSGLPSRSLPIPPV